MKTPRIRNVFLLAFAYTGLAFAADANAPLTKQEVKTLISKAHTAEEHNRIAAYFKANAQKLDAQAAEHEELAAEYAKQPTIHEAKHPMSGETASHCKFFAEA